jgi:drug/metabolite transporter (DMT)-like permease
MIGAVFATLCFACSAATASRSARLLGAVNANLFRLLVAALLLTAYALSFGKGLAGAGLGFFLASGFVGFGLGDVALFFSYQKIGSRRGVLLAQCLAVPFAALAEWLWMGTVLRLGECVLVALILAGVSLAVAPNDKRTVDRRSWAVGIGCGVLAGLGQAGGAVLSRKAFALNREQGLVLDGWTSAFQRIWPGVLVALLFYAWFRHFRRPFKDSPLAGLDRAGRREAARFVLANALAGPVLGVGCYQWGLSQAPSGLVLAIVAATPIAVMPLSYWLEQDKPSLRSWVGALVAVGGVLLLLRG